MLKILRKSKRSWIIFLMLGAIIVVFAFWGIGNFKVDKRNIVARVNGTAITQTEYASAYQKMVAFYKNKMGDKFSDDYLEKINLKDDTLQRLINTEIVLQEAKREGVTVPVEDVQKAIEAVPAFHKEGVFSKEQYLEILKANRVTPAEYEKGVENTLIIEKIRKQVIDAVNVTDKEIEDNFAIENKKVNFDYLGVDIGKFAKDVTVTDDEAKAYFEKNREAVGGVFKVPTKINAYYFTIPLNNLLSRVKVSEDDIKGYYEKNIGEFQTKKEVLARHILIKGHGDEAKKKAEDILSSAKKGEDFAKLAGKYSEDAGSAKHGGSVGYFKEGAMVKPFENAAFSMKKGEISDIVETQFGYHIIKVEDVKEAGTVPLKEATVKIEKKLKDEGAKRIALDLASDINKGDFKAEASKRKYKVVETGVFSENDAGVELVKNEGLKTRVFSMKAGEVDAVEAGANIYIVKVLEKKEGHLPNFEEAKDFVKSAMLNTKIKERAREASEAILKRLKDGEEMMKIASEGYAAGETGLFTKADGSIRNIGIDVADKMDLFSLDKNSPYYGQPIFHGNTFYILKLKDIQEADMTGLEKNKEEIKSRLLKERKDTAFDKWLDGLRAKAKIKINKEAM